MMASSDTFEIVIHGRGGHGSAPHETLDPVPVACELVTQIQVMIARTFNIFDPVVVTCGSIIAGSAPNIIPDDATLELTIRAFSDTTRQRIKEELRNLSLHLAASSHMVAEIKEIPLYPVTHNDPSEYDFCQSVIDQVLPSRWALQETPMAAAEDFSKIIEHIPGCFIGVSAVEKGEDAAQLPFNHSAKARFSDSVVPDCALILASLAYSRLASTSQ